MITVTINNKKDIDLFLTETINKDDMFRLIASGKKYDISISILKQNGMYLIEGTAKNKSIWWGRNKDVLTRQIEPEMLSRYLNKTLNKYLWK